jgi:hypothetical protein
VDYVAPSYNEPGVVEHYVCSGCEKYFSDERAKIELKRRDLAIPQLISYKGDMAEVSIDAMNLAITEAGKALNVKIVAHNEETPATKVSIPLIPVMSIANANKTLTIVTDKVSANMDQKLMKLLAQSEGKIVLDVKEIALDTLNQNQTAAMAEFPVYQAIDATLMAGEQIISDFGDGKVTMKVSFTPAEGTTAREYQLWYIAEDGTIEKLRTRYENGQLVVNMKHFSQYIIVHTGASVEWYVWVLLAVLILAAAAIVLLVIMKKRKGAAAEETVDGEAVAAEAADVAEELSIEEQIEKAIEETTEV